MCLYRFECLRDITHPAGNSPFNSSLLPDLKSPSLEFKVLACFSMNRRGSNLPALAALLTALPAWGAAPILTGLYRVGRLGIVDFGKSENQFVGTLKQSSACGFPQGVRVVSGSLEGSVFVGEVLLCQDGPSCAERRYPVLGIVHGSAVVAEVKLDPGCRSLALRERTLEIVPATAEERKRVVEELALGGSKNALRKSAEELATDSFSDGDRAMARGDYSAAREAFGRAAAYDDSMWEYHFGLGAARVNLEDPKGALDALNRALSIAQRVRADASSLVQIHYNLACAYAKLGRKKEALESLRTLARLPVSAHVVDSLDGDPHLASLTSDAEFERIVSELRRARPRERQRKPK